MSTLQPDPTTGFIPAAPAEVYSRAAERQHSFRLFSKHAALGTKILSQDAAVGTEILSKDASVETEISRSSSSVSCY
jgi:hypothetical protein